MKDAINKIMKFVIGDIDIENFSVEDYPTPELNVKKYEVNILVSSGIDMVDAETLSKRLRNSFAMLGFNSIRDSIVYLEDRDRLLIKIEGKI